MTQQMTIDQTGGPGDAGRRILVSDPLGTEGVDLLSETAKVDVRTGLSEDELVSIIGDYDALIVRSGTQVTGRIIDAAERLIVIGRAGVGTDNIDTEAATRRGIMVVNAPTGNTIAAVEHTIAMMLALARHIPQADASLRDGRWDRKKFMGVEVKDKVLGIVGLGRIGRQVARRVNSMDMEVLAFDAYVSADVGARYGARMVSLDELFEKSDFITLHTPLTDETRGIIGPENLQKVKKGVRIVNCARGPLVDEKALLDALERGVVAGAALDVFNEEPPSDTRLVNHPDVVATPHLGASTLEAQAGVAVTAAEQVLAVLSGKPAEYAVNAPIMPADDVEILEPFVSLCERMAIFSTQIFREPASRIRIVFKGEIAKHDTTALRASVIKGLLEPVSEERINIVNAELAAQNRHLEIIEEKSSRSDHYGSMITLSMGTDGDARTVSGTVMHGKPHIVMINEYPVDFEPEGYIAVLHNNDIPGVIGKVGTILGQENINIAFMQVGRNQPRGKAIMILGLDEEMPRSVVDMLVESDLIFDANLARV